MGAFKPWRDRRAEGLKWFFAITSNLIMATTVMGLWIAFAYSQREAIILSLLIAGAAAPALILML